jgi:hypothetical protein
VKRLLLATVLVASGCGTGNYHHGYNGRYCANPTAADAAFGVVDLFLGVVAVAAEHSESSAQRQPLASRPAQPTRRVFGTVSWASGERVAAMPLRVRSNSGFLDFELTTDERGRFWIPLPLPADWYRISFDDERASGETRLWLRDLPPAYLDIRAQPKEAPPSD